MEQNGQVTPVPETLNLPSGLRERIIAHCLAGLPNEACGLIASDSSGSIVAVYPTGNEQPSPVTYTIPPGDHYAALRDADAHGWELSGVFHSHPNGPARPSVVDLASAPDPTWIYLVVDMRGEPTIRAWRIHYSQALEVGLA